MEAVFDFIVMILYYHFQQVVDELPCLTTLKVCPGVNESDSVEECGKGKVWDGYSCINPHECPCIRDDTVRKVSYPIVFLTPF